jgi:hypothetical protein
VQKISPENAKEILGEMSHDSVNRFLLREQYEPKNLFDEVKRQINLEYGTCDTKHGSCGTSSVVLCFPPVFINEASRA